MVFEPLKKPKITKTRPATAVLKPFADLDLETKLKGVILGQDEAVEKLVEYVELYYSGLNDDSRPIANLLFLGITGTGKTALAEALATALHGSPRKLIKIDCAEFQQDHEVAKIIGSPPGYLGHKATGALLSQSALNDATSPSCDISILLFDEIEKAAPALRELLLGVMDRGNLTLGTNQYVSLTKCLIIFTSNFGMTSIVSRAASSYGFGKDKVFELNSSDKKSLSRGLVKSFSSEFINRIDDTIFFNILSADILQSIVRLEIKNVLQFLVKKQIYLPLPSVVSDYFISQLLDSRFGAREIKRLLRRELLLPLAKLISSSKLRPIEATVELLNDKLYFSVT